MASSTNVRAALLLLVKGEERDDALLSLAWSCWMAQTFPDEVEPTADPLTPVGGSVAGAGILDWLSNDQDWCLASGFSVIDKESTATPEACPLELGPRFRCVHFADEVEFVEPEEYIGVEEDWNLPEAMPFPCRRVSQALVALRDAAVFASRASDKQVGKVREGEMVLPEGRMKCVRGFWMLPIEGGFIQGGLFRFACLEDFGNPSLKCVTIPARPPRHNRRERGHPGRFHNDGCQPEVEPLPARLPYKGKSPSPFFQPIEMSARQDMEVATAGGKRWA